ncbi:MAG: CBS domain-containing protein [Actinomycetes bacterium]|jgi:CBS domain-containing protein|nr:MAG: CBS domain-containing protein [Actinomycetota bacterium]
MTQERDPQRLTARDVMSRVLVTVDPNESPLLAWELMRRSEVRHLPVVDREGKVAGVLSREMIAAQWGGGGPDELNRRPVGELLTHERRPRVMVDTPVPDVAATMLDARCDAVPVVAEDGTLLGLITAVDLLAVLAGRPPKERVGGDITPALFRMEPVLHPPQTGR